MGWSDYQRWIDRGRPFRLMTPARDLRDVLRRHGYTVYDIGNESHLTHEPPEDHTPYSETSYPGGSVYGVGYAIDVMPPARGARSKVDGLPLPSLQQLGAQLVADRKAGVSGIRWLKYINWEPQEDNGGPCYQDSWKPNYARRSSTDRGHIHASGLTGFESSTIGAGYDPVARIRGEDDDMTPQELLNATITNPVTGKPATIAAFFQSINREAYEARLTAEAALAAVKGVDDEGIKALIRDTSAADAGRDTELAELVRAGQSGELTADQVLAKLRDLLPAGGTPQS